MAPIESVSNLNFEHCKACLPEAKQWASEHAGKIWSALPSSMQESAESIGRMWSPSYGFVFPVLFLADALVAWQSLCNLKTNHLSKPKVVEAKDFREWIMKGSSLAHEAGNAAKNYHGTSQTCEELLSLYLKVVELSNRSILMSAKIEKNIENAAYNWYVGFPLDSFKKRIQRDLTAAVFSAALVSYVNEYITDSQVSEISKSVWAKGPVPPGAWAIASFAYLAGACYSMKQLYNGSRRNTSESKAGLERSFQTMVRELKKATEDLSIEIVREREGLVEDRSESSLEANSQVMSFQKKLDSWLKQEPFSRASLVGDAIKLYKVYDVKTTDSFFIQRGIVSVVVGVALAGFAYSSRSQ